MKRRNVVLAMSVLILASCGQGIGGPSDAELKRACIDTESFIGPEPPSQVCDCMVAEIKSRKLDKAYIMEHWEAQAQRRFGKSILPASVDPDVKRKCGGY